MKDTESGVQTALYLALSQKLRGASGKYYSDCAEARVSCLAQDDTLAAELYEYSLAKTGL